VKVAAVGTRRAVFISPSPSRCVVRAMVLPLCITAVLLSGCADSAPVPTEALSASVELFSRHPVPHDNATHPSGSEEVPPADTRAQGQMKVRLSQEDGTSLHYRLIVAKLETGGSGGDALTGTSPQSASG
jgi:hypothetical protein